MAAIRFLYVTAPDEAAARKIADGLIEARLAACVNIIPGMRSVYRWEGKIESANELVLIVKTTAAAASAARDLIRKLHPYELPCVVALAADEDGSNADFLAWISREVGWPSSQS
jgi:periplasmic divalent cation tolerance protein